MVADQKAVQIMGGDRAESVPISGKRLTNTKALFRKPHPTREETHSKDKDYIGGLISDLAAQI